MVRTLFRSIFTPHLFIGLGLIIVSTSLFMFLLHSLPGITFIDGLFHYAIAENINLDRWWVDITWLPYTILGDSGTDHHWLFHLWFAPWVKLSQLGLDRFESLLFCTSLNAGMCVGAAYWIARMLGLRWPILLALAFLFIIPILAQRLLMFRAQNLSIIFCCLIIALLYRRQYAALLPISFLYFHTYHGAYLLGLVLVLYSATHWNQRHWQRPYLFVGAGFTLSILSSPWFPHNIEYVMFHLFFKMTGPALAHVGTEWSAPNWQAILQAWPAHLSVMLGLIVIWKKRCDTVSAGLRLLWWMNILAIVFLVFFLRYIRMIEYYGPFALITGACALNQLNLNWFLKEEAWLKRGRLFAVLAFLSVMAYQTMTLHRDLKQNALINPEDYKEHIAYLDKHAKPNALIINSAWPDFVRLMWHSTRYHYLNGLDIHYLAYKSPKLFELWYTAVYREDLELPSELLVSRFLQLTEGKAIWFLVHRRDAHFANRLLQHPNLALVNESKAGWLLKYSSTIN